MEKLRIATRDSKLAKFQAERFAKLLTQSGLNVEIIKARTLGDHDTKSPLYELKQVGIFTSELNKVLIDGEAHSQFIQPRTFLRNLKMAWRYPSLWTGMIIGIFLFQRIL